MLKVRSSLVASVAVVLSLACSAQAGSVSAVLGPVGTAPGDGVNPGTQVVTVTFGTASPEANAFVGQINFNSADTSADQNDVNVGALESVIKNGDFSTYCIEGLQNVIFSSPETWHGDGSGSDAIVGLADAPNPETHFTSTGSPNQVEELTEFWDRFYNSSPSDLQATAFQLGIWEIANDGNTDNFSADPGNPHALAIALFGGNSSNGNFEASNDDAATDLAATWLAQLTGNLPSSGTTYSLFALTDGTIQDQLFGVANPNSGGSGTVPLPAALPAGLTLLGGLTLLNFRRCRVN